MTALAVRADSAEALTGAVRRRFGGSAKVENLQFPTLGGSSRTVIFELVLGRERRRLVSRQTTYVAPDSPFIPTQDQFRALQVAHRHGVPSPEPVFAYDADDAMGQGYVTSFLAGETMPKRIQSDPAFGPARARLTEAMGAALARLHAIDPCEFGFIAATPDSVDPLAAQRLRYDSYGEPHPAIEVGLRWLEHNRPALTAKVPLHGDFRLGNLMVDHDGLQGVLDWECAHLGDPHEDVGWLCTRSWRFARPDLPAAGLATREAFLAAYQDAGGRPLDREAVRYWEVFGLLRWAVLNIMQAHGHVHSGRTGVVFAACGRNVSLVEYDLMMTLMGRYA